MDRKAQEMMWSIGSNKAFTFVELMVTVVILAVGLTLIIQGFITAAGALNTTQNHRIALQFLENKMQEIEAAARIDKGVKRENSQGEFSSETRNFTWNLEVVGVEEAEDLDLSEDLNELTLKVAWTERNSPRDLSLITYMRNKKE